MATGGKKGAGGGAQDHAPYEMAEGGACDALESGHTREL
jgi:hypothetical protein